ncbi:MAG: hypothetical protein RBR40_15665 [Tenuifilaceae bacterium]|jgi:hypothetical protein|nr:hypothetical protein [Tenuifilaceae bacterium]
MRNILFVFIIILFSCRNPLPTEHQEDRIHDTNNILKLHTEVKQDTLLIPTDFVKVQSLTDTVGKWLGDIYVNPIEEDVFRSLLILQKNDTLYKIEKNIFSNVNGIDIITYDDGCYEYAFTGLYNDYIIVSAICRGNNTVSDDIYIEWKYKKKVFEVFRTL